MAPAVMFLGTGEDFERSLPKMKADNHMIAASCGISAEPHLIENVLSPNQLKEIYQLIGRERLEEMAAVSHDRTMFTKYSDFEPSFKREARDLAVIKGAIRTLTEYSNPWILETASEFAKGLLVYINRQQPQNR